MLKPGDEIELTVDKFADRGKCLSRLDEFIVFTEGTIPGERVKIRIHKKKKNYAEAKVITVLEKSPKRVEPPCRYFGFCGGCKWQHVAYEYQLEAKRKSVEDALSHIGGFEGVKVNPTIGSPNIYGYRNKMEFSFSARCWLTGWETDAIGTFDTDFALGLHAPGQFSSVINIESCLLQRYPSSSILNTFREIAKQKGWTAWDTKKRSGFLNHLVIRISERTGKILVNLVTNGYNEERMVVVGKLLQSRFPEITTFVNAVNKRVAQTAFAEEIKIIYGSGVIDEHIGHYRFEIAPNTFFQTNTSQAERLYEVIMAFAELRSTDLVYDLYCGVGTISIFLSPFVKQVVGIELVEEAVQNAQDNAKANGVTNSFFLCGDAMKVFTSEFVQEYGKPDVIVVDPPRPGLHRKIIEQITHIRPSRLIYVSCNPMTQLRDMLMLQDIYRIEAVQPLDFFPQTQHIETVIKLKLKGMDN